MQITTCQSNSSTSILLYFFQKHKKQRRSKTIYIETHHPYSLEGASRARKKPPRKVEITFICRCEDPHEIGCPWERGYDEQEMLSGKGTIFIASTDRETNRSRALNRFPRAYPFFFINFILAGMLLIPYKIHII